MIEGVEGVRQVIGIGGHHQGAVFIGSLLHGIREAGKLLDQLDLVLGEFIVEGCRFKV